MDGAKGVETRRVLRHRAGIGCQTRTLPLAAFTLLNVASFSFGTLTATAVLITLPIILLSLLVQRYLIAGLTIGGVK